jgi:succinate dehydrogenase flavin-adding protein (antitoxin of CptAB toxin-antitoxin module)
MGKRLYLATDRPVLHQLLEAWDINFTEFSRILEVKDKTLLRYRKGQRKFTLNTKQIKILHKMLDEIGLSFDDLPDDWIVES